MAMTADERRHRRTARVTRRLLRAVETLLEERESYLDLTVEHILEAADIARSTFYSYFDDKADLLIALSETAMQDILAGAQAIWELPPDPSREQVGEAVRHTIQTYLPHTRLMNAVLEASMYDRRVRERYAAAYGEAQQAATEHIAAGQAAGYVRPELHPREAAGWLTWMAERGMTQLVQNAGRAELRRLEDTFTAILWHTLYDGCGADR